MSKTKVVVIGVLIAGSLMISAGPVLARDRHRDHHRRSYAQQNVQDYWSRERHNTPPAYQRDDYRDYSYDRRDLRHDRRDMRRDSREGALHGR